MNNNTMKYNRNFMINNEPINELIDSQNIFDNLTCGVYIKKLDGELVYLNKFVEELLNDSNLYMEAERHKEIIEKEDFGVVHYDENIRREITIIKDGKEIQMSVIKNSIKDKEQNIIGIIGMLQLLPVEINIRREIVKMINDNKLDTKHLSNKTDLMRSLNFIASRIQNYIDCEGLSIWLHNYKNDFMERFAKCGNVYDIDSIENDFFTNISHELKTPINIILGSNQLMELNYKNHNITDEKLKNSINLTKQNSYRLLKLVGNFLDISKMGAGFYEIEPINTNIVSVVENIGQSVEPYMAAKKIQFIFDTETEEEIVACDPDKIERIVLNLLSNAIKYTNENGKIFVNVASKESVVEISVEDTGTGIPKDKVEKVFNRFEQVDPSLVKKREGCGIGLSLTKHLVEMHGGEIWVESQEGKGSKFIFTIPKQLVNNQTDEAMDILDDSTRVDKCRIEFSDIYSIQ